MKIEYVKDVYLGLCCKMIFVYHQLDALKDIISMKVYVLGSAQLVLLNKMGIVWDSVRQELTTIYKDAMLLVPPIIELTKHVLILVQPTMYWMEKYAMLLKKTALNHNIMIQTATIVWTVDFLVLPAKGLPTDAQHVLTTIIFKIQLVSPTQDWIAHKNVELVHRLTNVHHVLLGMSTLEVIVLKIQMFWNQFASKKSLNRLETELFSLK